MERDGWVVGVQTREGRAVRVYFQTFEKANGFVGKHPGACIFLERYHVSRHQARAQEPLEAERSAATLPGQEAHNSVRPSH